MFDEEICKEIAESFKLGVNVIDLTKKFKCGKRKIYHALKSQGLETTQLLRSATPEEQEKIIQDYKNEMSLSQISIKYGFCRDVITRIIKKNNISIRKNTFYTKDKLKTFTQEEKDYIYTEWKNGKGQRPLSKELRTAYSKINKVLREFGVTTKDMRLVRERHPLWKGKHKQGKDGYILVKLDEVDPFYCMANSRGYVLEHRIVKAREYGRPLRKDESVHHKDGDGENNLEGNLQLRLGSHGAGQSWECYDCKSQNLGPCELAGPNEITRIGLVSFLKSFLRKMELGGFKLSETIDLLKNIKELKGKIEPFTFIT